MSERFLLVKGSSGLGNRISVLLSALLYSRRAKRTPIFDWRDGICAPAGVNALPFLFSSPPPGPLERLPATDSVRPSAWRGHLDEPVSRMIATNAVGRDAKRPHGYVAFDFARADYEEEVLVLWNFGPLWELLERHFVGPLADLGGKTRDEVLGETLRTEVALHPAVRDRVEEFAARHLRSPTIGIHVRYADYRAPLRKLFRALNTVLARLPGAAIFLATDNVEIKRLFERTYPRVVTRSHWYPPPGMPIHFAARARDPLAATIDALVDIHLLARCDWLIVDRSSSFSYLAKLWADPPATRIVDVGGNGKGSPIRVRRVWLAMRLVGAFRWGLRLLPRVVPVRRL